MNKVLSLDQAIAESKKRSPTQKLVLAGGCFDILHKGHITFLQASKNLGDLLYILLESDETVKRLKGENRPVNSQQDRARVLASLESVDRVICLPPLAGNQEYNRIVIQLKPAIITTTKGDQFRFHKERQASLVEAKVIDVVSRITKYSSTKLAQQI